MLDVHIIINPRTRRDWLRECLDSVQEAKRQAGFTVHVHHTAFTEGHIGRSRAIGYAMGSQPYVTCVDDDDYVLPHAFEQMRQALQDGAEAVFTKEHRWQNGHLIQGRQRHHLVAFRREYLIDHEKWPSCGDVAQVRSFGERGIDLPEPAYVHRIYLTSAARVLRRRYPLELQEAVNYA